jgi:hypothetical protein
MKMISFRLDTWTKCSKSRKTSENLKDCLEKEKFFGYQKLLMVKRKAQPKSPI